jgi:hypothetical protein
MKKKIITQLSFLVILLVWFNAGVGLFYSNSGSPRYVESIHGVTVQLFGDGIYANQSTLTAGIRKGTDLVMLLLSVGFLVFTLKRNVSRNTKLIHAGLLFSILYYSITLAFETVFNRLFLSYTALLSVAFFAFIFTIIDLIATVRPTNKEEKHTKTAIFTMIAGCSGLVWLMDIIPATITNVPPEFMSIYTTNPTKILDIGIFFPTFLLMGIMLLRREAIGYVFVPILLMFVPFIAVVVIAQTAFHILYEVYIPVNQLVGYVGVFVIFGSISAVVNAKFMMKM